MFVSSDVITAIVLTYIKTQFRQENNAVTFIFMNKGHKSINWNLLKYMLLVLFETPR